MNKKNIILVLLAVVVLGGLMLWGKNNQASAPSSQAIRAETGNSQVFSGQDSSSGVLSVSEKLYDFGKIPISGGKVSRVFRINNITGGDIKLESVTTSCMCTEAFIINGSSRKGPFGMPGHSMVPKVNDVIKAGETRDVEVVYDPAAHGPAGVGYVDRFVYLVDSKGNTLELEIKAVVTP